ncbi:MAG: hypothetical protein WA082_00780 [Candidatus Moraniibacteriota bacterium]
MSTVSLGRMVTLPYFVTRILRIVVAIISIGNKKIIYYIQRSPSDAEMLQLLAQLERHDTLVATRDSARLKAEAARLAALAEASA